MLKLKKLKLYLDTSVISHLDAQDALEKMTETRKLWDEIKLGNYEAVISDVTIDEINKCDDNKKHTLYDYVAQIKVSNVGESEESIALAKEYLRHGVLKEKSYDDCRHIALATVVGVDCVVSWNFKHFVNVKTIDKVQGVNRLFGYNEVKIVAPSMLLGDDEDD